MLKIFQTLVLSACLIVSAILAPSAWAADTDVFADILKKVDALVCAQPAEITQYYGPKLVIMVDDKRALLENRVKSYQQMLADHREMKCKTTRTILSGNAGKDIGYVLVDELISVTSRSMDSDERQHSVCTYAFKKEGGDWKISLEHCSSLPDYTIVPGDDALYYFHNPVY